MSKLNLRYISLEEAAVDCNIDPYRPYVHPLDYEFGLWRNNEFLMLGTRERNGALWLFVAPAEGEIEVQFLPAILFSAEGDSLLTQALSADGVRVGAEVVPRSLSGIDHWFGKYIDADRHVVELVSAEVIHRRAQLA